MNSFSAKILENVNKVIVGKDDQIELLLISLLVGGHVLLEDVPGTGKTKTAKALAQSLDLDFKRVQFTIDLLPSDLTGINFFDRQANAFVFRKGPLFTNILLADEINRATARTQSSLLECMEEKQVTVDGDTRKLEPPFLVIATQNPVESQGTFPLPEAQLDRFFFNIKVDYPSRAEECEIIRQTTGEDGAAPAKVLSAAEIVELQSVVRRVPAADHVVEYAADLVRATRPKTPEAPEFVKELVSWGAGPRAGMALVTAAKARAVLNGRAYATTADVKWAALPVMRHRIATTFNAEAAGVTTDDVVKRLLDHVQGHEELDV